MHVDDEPLFPENECRQSDYSEPESQLVTRIRRLVTERLDGVLCTQGQARPCGSLIAFAFSDDLSRAVFSTPITARKYENIICCSNATASHLSCTTARSIPREGILSLDAHADAYRVRPGPTYIG